MKFEILVATRYLKAKRKQAAISLITAIAVLGVGAGVAALVIAMAVSTGLREDLQERLLGAQAHLTILPRGSQGVSNYMNLARELEQVEGVAAAAPHARQGMVLYHNNSISYVLVNGIVPEMESGVSAIAQSIVEGDFAKLEGTRIAVGKELADTMGIRVGDSLKVLSPVMGIDPIGIARPISVSFEVVAIFSLGLFEYDTQMVYVPMATAQYLLGVDEADVVTGLEVNVRNLDEVQTVADRIREKLGADYQVEGWEDRYRTLFQALKLERLGMAIAIGLIVFVAALNIVATLTMMVLEKTRDIAALMSMGASPGQVRKIFVYQGVIIGVIGTAVGLIAGHLISYAADTYRLIALAPDVYPLPYLPFHADFLDSAVIAAAAILISFLATLYPSGTASRVQPVEALRYE